MHLTIKLTLKLVMIKANFNFLHNLDEGLR